METKSCNSLSFNHLVYIIWKIFAATVSDCLDVVASSDPELRLLALQGMVFFYVICILHFSDALHDFDCRFL